MDIYLSEEFVEISKNEIIEVDIRYATENNFLKKNLYGTFNKAVLHRIAADKFHIAVNNLQKAKPQHKLIIFDALRPRSVQHVLWKAVKGTDHEQYIANPFKGSIHNFGFAVDLSILDSFGKELDMGTDFDAFTLLSQPQLEDKFLTEGKLTIQQLDNRHLLRDIMHSAGFRQLPSEWWHFDALPHSEVHNKYKIIE